ncbi:hypothetical protein [Deinococcus pimensis]|uniref:hypothetical protein n=1 Tax=Deinococcus pimensis TaxID=309888 RepID=UPI000489FD16|nr:hypothetical protein [Deinococcus pimensis]
MSRAFVKDDADVRWTGAEEAPEFAVYWGRDARSLDPDPVRQGSDFAGLLRWAARQPGGYFQVRDRAGHRLAELTDR